MAGDRSPLLLSLADKYPRNGRKVGTDPVSKSFRTKNGLQLTFALFAALLGTIIGFAFTGSIGITRLCNGRCSGRRNRLGWH